MDEVNIYGWIRVVNFGWAFILFWFMTFGFILDRVISRGCSHTHIPPEMHLWMTAAYCSTLGTLYGTSVLLFQSGSAGIQVFSPIPALIFGSIAIAHALHRVQSHRVAIELGVCK